MRAQLKTKDFEILDSIRGIASLYVAIAHCRGTLWIGGSQYLKMFPRSTWGVGDYLMVGSSMLTRLAVEFVIVFFVLSGFSIAHSLTSNKAPLKFYLRRLIRIYPSYVVALIWAGLIFIITRYLYPQWYDGSLKTFSFERTIEMNVFFDKTVILNNLLYRPSYGFINPFWSLTYEVIFYLLAPFILRKVNLYALISVALFTAFHISPSFIESLKIPLYINEFLFTYNIYFVIGVMLYTYFASVQNLFEKVSKALLLVFLIGCLGVTYMVNFYFKIETVFSFFSAAILGVLLIVYFIKYQVKIGWLMSIGKLSYTLYITHVPSIFLYLAIFWTISGHSAPYILNYFVWMPAVLFVLVLAWVQYSLVEKRTKKILNFLRKPQNKKLPDTAVTSGL